MSNPSTSNATKKRGLPMRVKMRHDSHFVEELARRSEAPVGKVVALAAIETDPQQPRQSMGDLSDLVASVQEKGVLEPILVRRNPRAEDDPSQSPYVIISGERRYRAALEAGLYEIPVIEMEVSEEEALEIALIENLQRKDLTPFEEGDGYRSLAERYSYTHEEIAAAVGKSRSAVTESLSLLRMPRAARDVVKALGITSKSVLLEVLKADSEEEMIRLLERVSSLGLSRDGLRREIKRQKRSFSSPGRRKPYVFRFHAPDKRYRLSLSFRQSTVDQDDLILALEETLKELRKLKRQESGS